MDKATIDRFGIGYAPSGGDLLLRHLKGNMPRSCWESQVSSHANRMVAACSTASAGASRSPSRTKAEKSSRWLPRAWR